MIYDTQKSYEENFSNGPNFTQDFPQRLFPPREKWLDFLGFPVASPFGVPAGPLLNSAWISFAAKLGYDILTYKTIRTKSCPSHPLPNIVPITFSEDEVVYKKNDFSKEIAITNSFGMPSQSPEFLKIDIPKALASIQDGQVLVVSVVGSGDNQVEMIDDFVEAALMAKSYGAPIIEANFSCPNVITGEGGLYSNPNLFLEVSKKLREALEDTPLIIKIGNLEHQSTLKEIFIAAAKAGVSAISGINTIKKAVINQDGSPALGVDRKFSGICGAPIYKTALSFIKNSRYFINNEDLTLKLIGVGGVSSTEQIDQLLEEGADFVQTATGMMFNPLLAMNYGRSKI